MTPEQKQALRDAREHCQKCVDEFQAAADAMSAHAKSCDLAKRHVRDAYVAALDVFVSLDAIERLEDEADS